MRPDFVGPGWPRQHVGPDGGQQVAAGMPSSGYPAMTTKSGV